MQTATVSQWVVLKINLIVNDYVTALKAMVSTARYNVKPVKLKTVTFSVKEIKDLYRRVKAIGFQSQ